MRAVKFCTKNLRLEESKTAFQTLQTDYAEIVTVHETDCFRRCLQCKVKPYCRVQLDTIEAVNADLLVEKVLEYIK